MKLFKKFKGILVIIALVLVCLSLAGCDGEKKEIGCQTTEGQETQPPKEESIADLFTKGKQVGGISFDYVFTTKDFTMNGKMWIQDKKVKTESTVEGNKVIMIFDGETVYNYNPSKNIAIKFSVKDFQENMVTTPYDYTENIDMNTVTLVERTIYDGVKCKVFMVKQKDINIESKMWVREDYGIPVRIETTETEDSKVVIEYKNLQVESLPQDTFKLPDRVQIQDPYNN